MPNEQILTKKPSPSMQRALALAGQARSHCHPNPMVGCVLVKEGQIVGEGWHRQAGTAHAEAHALEAAGAAAQGATAYVTLEPCNHWGRTPPCTRALIDAGVARVVMALRDPNPVAGGGVETLRSAGIEVLVGDGAAEAARLNEHWLAYVQNRRPFVHLKIAMSLDGKVATQRAESRWITGPEARQLGHRWRDSHEAILVGANTLRVDDPALTVRLQAARLEGPLPLRQPLRIVLAGQMPLPVHAQLFRDGMGPTLVVTTAEHAPIHDRLLKSYCAQVEVLCLPEAHGYPDPAALLDDLYEREIVGLLVEGGPSVAATFLDAGLVDRISTFIAPKLIGPGGAPAFRQTDTLRLCEAPVLQEMESTPIGADLLITGKPIFPHLETKNLENDLCLLASSKN